jgi:hypothetical protein
MTSQQRYELLSTQPWREYFPYRPEDMPPKNGNKAKLMKMLALYGATDDEGDDDERL